jgi:hypothetical protein
VVRNGMKRLAVLALVLASTATGMASPQAPAAAGGDLAVTVTWKGKGEVKAGNEIAVFLFSTPEINAQSEPIGMQTSEKNGGVMHFQNLPDTVYIAVVYDEKGTYDQEGPPPPGTPTKIHGEKGVSTGVKTGKGAKVSITIDETTRMP